MPLLALVVVLLSACTHATWNLAAKRAAGARHFVFWYSAVSVTLYLPVIVWLVVTTHPVFNHVHWIALLMTSLLHMGYSLTLQSGYKHADLSLIYPLARGSGPLLSFFLAVTILGEPMSWVSVAGMLLIVGGIVLVTGLLSAAHKANGNPPLGVGDGTLIENAIVDKNCRIGRNVRIVNETGVDQTDETSFGMIRDGIVVMAKNTSFPDGWRMETP